MLNNRTGVAAAADTPPAGQPKLTLLRRRPAGPAAPQLQGWDLWLHRLYCWYAGGVFLSLAGSFIESFHNLVDYFHRNGYAGVLSLIAPLMIDIVTLSGESVILIATVLHWPARVKIGGWIATLLGLALSVAGNAGKDGWKVPGPHHTRIIPWEHIAAFSVPPLAMAGLLALSLTIVKRVWKKPGYPASPEGYPALPDYAIKALYYFPEVLSGGPVPGVPTIKPQANVGQRTAQQMRDYLTSLKADLDRYADEAGGGGAGS